MMGKVRVNLRGRIVGLLVLEEARGHILLGEHSLAIIRELQAVATGRVVIDESADQIGGFLELCQALGPIDSVPLGTELLDVSGNFLQKAALLVLPNGMLDDGCGVAWQQLLAHRNEPDPADEASGRALHLGGCLLPADSPGFDVAKSLLRITEKTQTHTLEKRRKKKKQTEKKRKENNIRKKSRVRSPGAS